MAWWCPAILPIVSQWNLANGSENAVYQPVNGGNDDNGDSPVDSMQFSYDKNHLIPQNHRMSNHRFSSPTSDHLD